MIKMVKNKKQLIILIAVNLLLFLFDSIFSGFFKVLSIIATVIVVIYDLFLIVMFIHMKDVNRAINRKSTTKTSYSSSSSTPTPSGSSGQKYVESDAIKFIDALTSDNYDGNYGLSEEEKALKRQIAEEEKQLSEKELKMWRIFYDYAQQGYKFASYKRMNTPLKWKKNEVQYLLTKSVGEYKKHYAERKKYEDKENWKNDHPILTGVGKGIGYVFSGQLLYDVVDKIAPIGNGGSVEQKESAQQAAKDIKRMLRSSGTYSDGSHGSCHYEVRDIYADKYDRIVVDVETSNYHCEHMASVDVPSLIRDNLYREIYDSVYPESGGFNLKVNVY